MIATLHRYVLRELLKAFVLTAVGLTLMFAMGGGLLNLIRIEQVSGADVARMLLYFVPLVASFMLPVAALLSCALVYGRLAADGELDACKASGINIHRLLASAVGLALVVGGLAFYLSNFTVPHLFHRISEIAQRDLPDMLVARLREQGSLEFQDHVIYAESARKVAPEEVAPLLGGNTRDKQVVLIDKAAYVQFNEADPVRTATAEKILLIFDRSEGPVKVSARMLNARIFDHHPPRFTSVQEQPVDLDRLPMGFGEARFRLKFCDLAELFDYQVRPDRTPMVQKDLGLFRQQVAGVVLARQFLDQLVKGGTPVLGTKDNHYRFLHASECQPDLEGAKGAQIRMRGNVRIEHVLAGRKRYYRADLCELSMKALSEMVSVGVTLRGKVTLHDPAETDRPVSQPSPCNAPGILIPLSAMQGDGLYSDEQILDASLPMQIPEPLQAFRTSVTVKQRDVQRQVIAAIHSRLSMSISMIVLVVLATALGIALRGGHALTAFGVAFIPTVIVVIVISAGRSMAERSDATLLVGLAMMWGIVALMAIVDAVVVFGGIRR